MTDFFLLLMLAGAGDELQGISGALLKCWTVWQSTKRTATIK